MNNEITPEMREAARALGRLGGRKCAENNGQEHYVKMGAKGGATTKARYGDEFYQGLGRKGGKRNAELHGSEFYRKIGQMGGLKVKAAFAALRAAEAAE